MTVQGNATSGTNQTLSEKELYDLEWSDGSDSNKDAQLEKPTVDDTDDSTKVADTTDGTKLEVTPDVPAEGEEGSVWDAAAPELKQAYLKAQNDLKSVVGRHTAAEKKRVDLEKELSTLKAVHTETTRKKGEYEQNHPELFNEVMAVVGARLPSQPAANTQPAVDDDAVRTVYKIHADIDAVLASPEWAIHQAAFSAEQNAQFNSADPFEFAALVSNYKASAQSSGGSRASASNQRLAAASGTSITSKSKAAPRTVTSQQEDYDAEWARA